MRGKERAIENVRQLVIALERMEPEELEAFRLMEPGVKLLREWLGKSRTPAKAGEDGVERAHITFVLAAAKIERGTRLDSLTVGEEKALVKAVLSSIEEPRGE